MSSSWNFADVWEVAADMQPDAPALVHGKRRISWAQMDRRADGVGRWLLGVGIARQDKVAIYLYYADSRIMPTFAELTCSAVVTAAEVSA